MMVGVGSLFSWWTGEPNRSKGTLNKRDTLKQDISNPKHTAKVVKKWLAEKNIIFLQWPSQSSNFNPFENGRR